MGKGWQSKGGAAQRYHKGRQGRQVAPGVSGFLFSCTTGPSNDRSKREIEGLLETYVPRAKAAGCEFPTAAPAQMVASDAMTGEERKENQGGDAQPESGGLSMASMLMAELSEVRTGRSAGGEEGGDDSVGQKRPRGAHNKKKGLGQGDHYRILDCNCKGYLFYGLDAPPKEPKAPWVAKEKNVTQDADTNESEEDSAENDVDQPPSKKQRLEDAAEKKEADDEENVALAPGDTRGTDSSGVVVEAPDALKRFPINWNVNTMSEIIFDDLTNNPAMVSRFTFKVTPVVATCNPSLSYILPIVKHLTSLEKIPEGRSAIMGGLALFIRNNTTMENKKKEVRRTVEQECFPTNRYFLVYPDKADVLITIAIMHSTCCIGISRRCQTRGEYNLNKLSAKALNLDNMIGAVPAATADTVEATAVPSKKEE